MSTPTVVAESTVVSFHYTLKNSEGEVLDSSDGGEPMAYLHGADNIVPGLEKQLAGRAVGDELSVVVEPEEGYGVSEGPGPQPVPRSQFPDDAELEAGMQVAAQTEDGDLIPLWVVEVRDDEVFIDHNHPLADTTLHFDVKIMAIRAASAEELAHGHPHGPGGHHHG